MNTADERKAILTIALDIGTRMLCCGAEIARVEDSISRILRAAGSTEVNVFSIISGIVVTASWEDEQETQTRRIHETGYNMTKLIALNELSRSICHTLPSPAEIKAQIRKIDAMPDFGIGAGCGIYALISSSFSVFFGGGLIDAVISAIIGVLIFQLRRILIARKIGGIMSILILSILGGIMAHSAGAIGPNCSPQQIAIGNVMLLVPGISLTNSIRDMFSGDTISGSLRFVESMLYSLVLAAGFALPALFF